MNQPQKHWIQATLGEDPYVPFEYFYDVSSWSNPLLMGRAHPLHGRPGCARPPCGCGGLNGGVRALAAARCSYEYTLDSSQAGALTFRLLDRGVALRRDVRRNVVSLPARRAPLGASGCSHAVSGIGTARASRRRPAGERGAAALARAVRGRGHFDDDRALLRGVPVRDRAALGAVRDDGHGGRRQHRLAGRSARSAR